MRECAQFKKLRSAHDGAFAWGKIKPVVFDRADTCGKSSGHYFHQDLLVARRIFAAKPKVHVDIGSRMDGFVAHVASYRELYVLDIRAIESHVPNVTFKQCDILGEIPTELVNFSDSVSCLHALEHFGLGRYGDPLQYDGHLRGFANLGRILQPGGALYLSVPIGPQRIEFNAHRVFSVRYLLSLLSDQYTVERFSYVDDRGDMHEDVALSDEAVDSSFGCRYGCGIFELRKATGSM
ncbi:MAG: DUF268 domain-containing protein [Chitinivibrionales bacterium]|nr:DUF268 domain-containing protein [Chitinivibrionales bacterium]